MVFSLFVRDGWGNSETIDPHAYLAGHLQCVGSGRRCYTLPVSGLNDCSEIQEVVCKVLHPEPSPDFNIGNPHVFTTFCSRHEPSAHSE